MARVYTLASWPTGIHASVVAGLGTCGYHHCVVSPNTQPQYGVWSTTADPKLLDDIALVSFVGISMLAPTRFWGHVQAPLTSASQPLVCTSGAAGYSNRLKHLCTSNLAHVDVVTLTGATFVSHPMTHDVHLSHAGTYYTKLGKKCNEGSHM